MNENLHDRNDGSESDEGSLRGRLIRSPLTRHPDTGEHYRLGTRLRNYLLTGLIVVGPVSITIYIVWWFVNLVDAWVKPLLPSLSELQRRLPFTLPFELPSLPELPGVGLVFAVIGLTVIGALTANLFGRTLVSYGEMMLGRMPIVRNVYSALKQIFETVLSQSGTSFQKVGLVEYPRKGIYSIVFISTETRGEIQARHAEGEDLVSVFLPTTPNPTSGFLLFLPKKDVKILDMSVEEAAKMVISAGLVVPEYAGGMEEVVHRVEAATHASGAGQEPHAPAEKPRSGRKRQDKLPV